MLLPGLTSRPWWAVSDVPGLAVALPELRAAGRAELAALEAATPGAAGDYAPKADEHTLHGGTWAWHSLIQRGAWRPAAAARAPRCTAALRSLPGLLTDAPFGTAFFSCLAGGAAVAPHFGPSNLRLRVHVPLAVPPRAAGACALTVAGEARRWDEHDPLVFDDAYEHSAENKTSERRDVLLFDVWHPELAPREIAAIQVLFAEAAGKGWLSPP